jgi:hypothetical protein
MFYASPMRAPIANVFRDRRVFFANTNRHNHSENPRQFFLQPFPKSSLVACGSHKASLRECGETVKISVNGTFFAAEETGQIKQQKQP